VPSPRHPDLLYGANIGDDAGVFRLRRDLAIVQSVDFFTPIVDDPFLFGQIAAANALSDVYAMGATPITALNLVSFPCKLGLDRLTEILRGGQSKIEEAGAVIVGGHSLDDQEPKYGLAVTGIVDPTKMITNAGAKTGQLLILTKKIGTGIISNLTKSRKGFLGKLNAPKGPSAEVQRECFETMVALNAAAARSMREFDCTACTDVTGFGLLGHAGNVAEASGVAMEIWVDRVPRFSGVLASAIAGTAGGGHRNLAFIQKVVSRDPAVTDEYLYLLCDAQTSGGPLMTVDSEKAEDLLAALHAAGVNDAAVIGRVLDGDPGRLSLKMSAA
jgi:selenide,water dikinase